MSKINWEVKRRQIPHRVHIGPNTHFEILWVDSFVNESTLGETRFNEKQIVIKKGMSDKLTVITYLHEVLHAASDKHDIKLTEKQVLQFEKFIPYWIKTENLFVG